MNREFRAAKKKQVKIVSPHWVNQSYEQHKLLDELQYPHNFDPNKSIEVSFSCFFINIMYMLQTDVF